MSKRCWHWLILFAVLFVALAAYFEPTHCVRGKLWGEAFFAGRPTSWWRRELENWDIETRQWRDGPVLFFRRDTTWMEEFAHRWLRQKSDNYLREKATCFFHGPRLVRDAPESFYVLRELLDDPSPKVRRFARLGLKMEPEFQGD